MGKRAGWGAEKLNSAPQRPTKEDGSKREQDAIGQPRIAHPPGKTESDRRGGLSDKSQARGQVLDTRDSGSRENEWALLKGGPSAPNNASGPRESLTEKWWYQVANPDPTPLASNRADGETTETGAKLGTRDDKCAESSDGRIEVRAPTAEEAEKGNEASRGAIRRGVAGMSGENRHYITVSLGGVNYKALFDPGACLSLVGPKIAERFKQRLRESGTCIKNVNGGVTPTLGVMKVMLEVEGVTDTVDLKAVHNLDQEMILGMDFCRTFDCDTRLGRGLWRVREGEWRPFASGDDAGGAVIYAECAGISELDDSERRKFERVVEEFLGQQAVQLGMTRLTEHHIDVQGAAPVKHRLRRMSPRMLEVASEEVERLRREGVIERSASDWSAPVLVKKSDGTYRFCVDYRDLNKVTRKDAYPISNMDAILDKLRRARYLTKIDLKQAYFQVPMEEQSKKYTAFAIPGSGLWQFVRMPFGLTNAPMTLRTDGSVSAVGAGTPAVGLRNRASKGGA